MSVSTGQRAAALFIVLLAVSACQTGGGDVQTVNPAGNYTANVNPHGGTGQ